MEYQEIEIVHNSKPLPVRIPFVDNLYATIHGCSDDPRLLYTLSPSTLDTIEYKTPNYSIPFSNQFIYRLDGLLYCHYIKSIPKPLETYRETYPLLKSKVDNAIKNKKLTYFIPHPTNVEAAYSVPKFASHAFIDLACKEYSYRKKKLFSFVILGSFSHVYEKLPLPLENYIDYEYRTCINLALEITAAYTQFREQINTAPSDPVLDKLSLCAFSHFSKHYLPFLVCSPYIYTRSILAHKYFQQLFSDYHRALLVTKIGESEITSPNTYFHTINGYEELDVRIKTALPSSRTTKYLPHQIAYQDEAVESKVQSLIDGVNLKSLLTLDLLGYTVDKAAKQLYIGPYCPISPLGRVNTRSDCLCTNINVTTKEPEDPMEELWGIVHPFDMNKLENNNLGWAVFCNSKHKHIENYLQAIRKASPTDIENISIQSPPQNDPAPLFSEVYSAVYEVLRLFR